jgi:hypothetical protein
VHATNFVSFAFKDLHASLVFVFLMLQTSKLCGVKSRGVELYGSSLEVLWSKFRDKSYMVKALCCSRFVV